MKTPYMCVLLFISFLLLMALPVHSTIFQNEDLQTAYNSSNWQFHTSLTKTNNSSGLCLTGNGADYGMWNVHNTHCPVSPSYNCNYSVTLVSQTTGVAFDAGISGLLASGGRVYGSTPGFYIDNADANNDLRVYITSTNLGVAYNHPPGVPYIMTIMYNQSAVWLIMNNNGTALSRYAWTAGNNYTTSGMNLSFSIYTNTASICIRKVVILNNTADLFPPIINEYPTITGITNVTNTNSSINISWTYLNQATGGVLVYKNGTYVGNSSYPIISFNITGLLNNTMYNITLFPYNASGTNYYVNASNSGLFKTGQWLYQEPPQLIPFQVIGLYNISLNNTILAVWNYTTQVNGGVKAILNGTQIATVNYPIQNYTFTGLGDSLLYNITIFAYNTTGTNYSVESGNSILARSGLYNTTSPPVVPGSEEYNLTGFGKKIFNTEGLNTTTSSGILYYILFLIFIGFIIFLCEVARIPVMPLLAGFLMFFYGFMLCFGISIIIGIIFMFCGICYGLGRMFSFMK